ncbi:hypothetical protein J1605_003724 [Eschrichtius robustus]|uniref:Formin GTPase-binding domain-containing protein n=1 Tax=Eschrichtius robustus TaxID=9764 RepID=A0AB34HMG0_ESCRO|nr:hypothetical protein J1605_003724 [Eschrichtius robustus]
MWDLPRPGLEPVSPALAGRFSTTAPPGKPHHGGLKNSKHECTLSSQEYVHELRSGISDEKLLNCLESLRVSLTSNPVSRYSRCSLPVELVELADGS